MEEQVFTKEQILLKEWFKACGMSNVRGLLAMTILWDEEATMEMLKYILDTEEKDPDKLYAVAKEISRKYKVVENLPD